MPGAGNIWLLIPLAATPASEVLAYTGTTRRQQSRNLLVVALSAMHFALLYAHLNQGPVSLVIVASYLLGWALLEHSQPAWACVLLSLGWAKPQLVVPVWSPPASLTVKRGCGRSFILGWLAGSVAQAIPVSVLYAAWSAGGLVALTWSLALAPTLSPHSWSFDQVLPLPFLMIAPDQERGGPPTAVWWIALGVSQAIYLALQLQTGSDQL